MTLIKELPKHEQPSVKLRFSGVDTLSNMELVAVTLGIENLTSAFEAIQKAGGLKNLATATPQELESFGLTKKQADKLAAAIELGNRALQASVVTEKVDSPDKIAKYFRAKGLDRNESLYCLMLNSKLGIVGEHLIGKGGISSISVLPQDVFREAVRRGVNNLIVVHNHPSGNPEPSHEDMLFTSRIKLAAKIIGINVLDHVIIGQGGDYVSLVETKLMPQDDENPLGALREDKDKYNDANTRGYNGMLPSEQATLDKEACSDRLSLNETQGSNVYVLSERGYRYRVANGLNDIKPGESIPNRKNKVPKSWVEKGWVKEMDPDARPLLQKNITVRPDVKPPLMEMEP